MEFDTKVTPTQLANLFSMTSRSVSRLTADGTLKKVDSKHYDLRQSILAYIDFNKELSRKSSGYDQSRAKKMAAEAEIKEIHLAKEKGLLVDADLIGEAIAAEYGIIRTRFLGLPSKIALQLSGLTDPVQVQGLLETQINEILSELTVDETYAELANNAETNQGENLEAED